MKYEYDHLPEEIKLHIFSFLNKEGRKPLLLVNHESHRLAVVSQCDTLTSQLEANEHYIGEVSFEELKDKRLSTNGTASIALAKLEENESITLYGLASLVIASTYPGTEIVEVYVLSMYKCKIDKLTGEIKIYKTSLDGQTDDEEHTANHLLQKLGIELPQVQNTMANTI